jgi:hypothetical protein
MVYLMMGFAGTYLGLEAAWHSTVCKIRDKSVQAVVFVEY